MDKQARERKYIDTGGIFCPRCGSGAIAGVNREERDKVAQIINCYNCHAEWAELYTLTSINIIQEGGTVGKSEKVELQVWCENQQRHDYMMRKLNEPLCQGCGREEAECSGDPCEAAIKNREGSEPVDQVYSVIVTDKTRHKVYVRARTGRNAVEILKNMDRAEWLDEGKCMLMSVTDRWFGLAGAVAERDVPIAFKIFEREP